jgi:hypothetical protein
MVKNMTSSYSKNPKSSYQNQQNYLEIQAIKEYSNYTQIPKLLSKNPQKEEKPKTIQNLKKQP